MTLAIKTANLGVAPIFTKANAKHSLLNQPFLVHDVVDWSEQILRVTSASRHSENAICFLSVKVVGFLFSAAEIVIEAVLAGMSLLSKVYLVVHYVAVIIAALSVTLVELTPAAVYT